MSKRRTSIEDAVRGGFNLPLACVFALMRARDEGAEITFIPAGAFGISSLDPHIIIDPRDGQPIDWLAASCADLGEIRLLVLRDGHLVSSVRHNDTSADVFAADWRHRQQSGRTIWTETVSVACYLRIEAGHHQRFWLVSVSTRPERLSPGSDLSSAATWTTSREDSRGTWYARVTSSRPLNMVLGHPAFPDMRTHSSLEPRNEALTGANPGRQLRLRQRTRCALLRDDGAEDAISHGHERRVDGRHDWRLALH